LAMVPAAMRLGRRRGRACLLRRTLLQHELGWEDVM
jgi:hypothetical protein